LWNASGWGASVLVDVDANAGRLVDLRAFFVGVARVLGGSFVPPGSERSYEVLAPAFRLTVLVGDPRRLEADVTYEEERDDFTTPLTVTDFTSPTDFVRRVLGSGV
jgi:hypothetical protein